VNGSRKFLLRSTSKSRAFSFPACQSHARISIDQVMVPAHDADRARLRPFVSLFLDEPDFGPQFQAVERVVENAVAMEIDCPPIGRLEESVPGLT